MKIRLGLAAATLLVASWAEATTVSLLPGATSLASGSQLTVDVVVSGLGSGQVVAGFDLDVLYDAAVLSVAGVSFGSALGLDGVDQFSNAILTAGRIDFAAISLLDLAALQALQLGSFTIAQLTFGALTAGSSSIRFDALTAPGLLFSDELGNALPVAVGTEANVTVTSTVGTVPVPGSLSLVVLALGLLPAACRLRQPA